MTMQTFSFKFFASKRARVLAFSGATLALTACEGWFEKDKEILSGTREAVLVHEQRITAAKDAKALKVEIPVSQTIQDWPQASGTANHITSPATFTLSSDLPAWETSVGTGSSEDNRILSGPIVSKGKVYTLDATLQVSAVSSETGEILWQVSAAREDADKGRGLLGGGLAYENEKIFVTSPLSELIALDAKDGKVLWRHTTYSPCRAAPTVKDGRVYAVTINNQLEVCSAKDGQLLWSHSGITESAGVLGGASPAVYEGIVVVPYTSGEIYALRAENGHPLWSESLSSNRRSDSVATLAHIRARPLIDHNMVLLVSYSGRMLALDPRTGNWLWSQDIGGQRTPAAAGNFLFLLTNANEMVCLERTSGKVCWVRSLPRYGDEADKKNSILWAGPLVINDQLVVANSNGKALFLSAKDGTITKEIALPSKTLISPIIAGKTLYFLTDNAELVAFR